MSSESTITNVNSANIVAFLPSGYDYRIGSCKPIDKSQFLDASILPPCIVSFAFKGSTHEELVAWFEEFKVRKTYVVGIGIQIATFVT